MSLVLEHVPPKPPVSAPPVVWSRVLGGGPIQRDFGHHVATNPRGEILVAARLAPLVEEPPEGDDDGDSLGRDDSTVDLSRGQLVKLAPDREPLWRVSLRATRLLPAPHVALDAAGCAYVAGPYTPHERGLRGATQVAVTKLGPDGSIEWSRSLFEASVEGGSSRVPAVRVAPLPVVEHALHRHSSVPWLSLAPTHAGGFAIAGYFSGGLRFGDVDLRSVTPATEAVFLAWTEANGSVGATAFQGPQLQTGLSVHGVSGGVVLSGWLCGLLSLGPHRIQSSGHTAALFLAKLTLS